jgi:cyclopropane fatty-acyl-phospholipid synthase-like methyltransferase
VNEQALLADLIRESSLCEVLDIGCGSGGPSLALVQQTKCRLTGVDVEASRVEHARQQTLARGLSDGCGANVLRSSQAGTGKLL